MAHAWGAAEAPVGLTDYGAYVVLSNGIVSIQIKKDDATIHQMTLNDSPNLAGRGAYFAVANSVGKDSGDIRQGDYHVVRQTPDLVEISIGAPVGGVYFTIYYAMLRGSSGFYVYTLEESVPGIPEHVGQARWSFYLNNSLFNYHLASDTEQGPIPNLAGSTVVQDATNRLANGTVYTKYNYCTYWEEDYVHGLCGSKPGSYGVFIITASHDYLQPPTKQEITVHAGPIIHAIIQSGHFEPRDLAGQKIPNSWTKLFGPWFVYLNRGNSPKEIWDDAKAQSTKERKQWPYAWMVHPEYPLKRGEVTGTLKLYDGQRPAANALMILTAPKPDWQLQVLNYVFSARADANGKFTLPAVRPGNYTLFAAVPGVTDQFSRANVKVAAGQTLDLGDITFNPTLHSLRLWQIGTADLRATGFKLSDQPRQYGLSEKVPANLTYVIGKSRPEQDWYYLQPPGTWTVEFKMDKKYVGEGVLTLGIAGQTNNPNLRVRVNDTSVGSYTGLNSSAGYRSAILGGSFWEEKVIRFPTSDLRVGTNRITFTLLWTASTGVTNVASTPSIMYDVVKLDLDVPTMPKVPPPPD
ncbi:MAG TPA: polysaccharide lyase family protein [Verrucomicrobiae bacterium]|nr:polysaccharide lyase family protein [Verrucomicrobiae bacterium]